MNFFVKCSDCGNSYEIDDCISEFGKYQCYTCYEKTHFKCSDCGKVNLKEDAVSSLYIMEGKPICVNCGDNNYEHCYICDVALPDERIKSLF